MKKKHFSQLMAALTAAVIVVTSVCGPVSAELLAGTKEETGDILISAEEAPVAAQEEETAEVMLDAGAADYAEAETDALLLPDEEAGADLAEESEELLLAPAEEEALLNVEEPELLTAGEEAAETSDDGDGEGWPYYIGINGMEEEGFAWLFDNGQRVLTLNTEDLDRNGVKYELVWEFGFYNPETGENEKYNDLFTLEDNGRRVILDGEKANTIERIRNEHGFGVMAAAISNGEPVAMADGWIEMRRPEYNVHFPLPEEELTLPDWGYRVESSFHCWVRNSIYPDGREFWLPVKDVTLENLDGNKAFELHFDRYGDGEDEYAWDIHPKRSGSARVTIHYEDMDGMEALFVSTLHCGDERYDCYLDIDSGSSFMLPGDEEAVTAFVEHWKYIPGEGHQMLPVDKASWEWSIPEEDQDVLKVEDLGGGHAKVTAQKVDNRRDARVCVTIYDVNQESGKKEEVGREERWFTVSPGFTELFPALIDQVMIGKSVTVTPKYMAFWVDENGKNQEEEVDDARFRWEFDENAFRITDQDGNVMGYNEDGYTWTDACYGTGHSFTLTRTGSWRTNVNLIVEMKDEDGEYHDDWRREYSFYGRNYDIWFEDQNEGDHSRVFEDGTTTFRVNTDQFDEDKIDYQIVWKAGRGWNEKNGELLYEIPGDYYSTNGKTITFDGAKMAANQQIKDQGYVDVTADILVNGVSVSRRGTHVRLEWTEHNYDFPLNEVEITLPHWDYRIESSFNCWVRNSEYPDGRDFEIFVKNVTLENLDGGEAFELEFDRYGEGDNEYAWDIRPQDLGSAKVTITYQDLDGSEKTFESTIYCNGDRYDCDMDVDSGSDMLLPGAEATLTAFVEHWKYTQRDGHQLQPTDKITWKWSVPEEFQDVLEVKDLGGGHAKVTALETEEDRDARVVVTFYDINSETGKKEEVGQEWINLHVAWGYTEIYPTRIDQIGIGNSVTVNPVYKEYWRDRDGKNHEKVIPEVRFRWEFDENAFRIEDKDGNVLGYNDEGYTWTEGCYGKDCSFKLTRTGSWGTDVTLIAEFQHEDGEYHEENRRNYWFHDRDYDIWFEDQNDGGSSFTFEDGTTTFRVNTEQLDEDKLNYEIVWKVGRGWNDENGELQHEIPGDYYSTKGNTITFDGAKMLKNEEIIKNRGNVDVLVKILVNGEEISREATNVWIRWSENNYDYPLRETEFLLPFWNRHIDSNLHLWVRNAEFEDGMDFDLPVTNVTVANDDPKNPAIEIWPDKDEDGKIWGWTVHATESMGRAVVTMTYKDKDGSEQQHAMEIHVGGDVYYPWINTDDGVEFLHAGETKLILAGVDHWTYSEEEGHGGPDMPEAVYKFEIPEESSWLLELAPQDSDPDNGVTIRAKEDEDGDAKIIVHVFGPDPESGKLVEVASTDMWLRVHSDYRILLPVEINGWQRFGAVQTVQPVYMHYYVDKDGNPQEETIEDVRFRWEFDPDAIVIRDEAGNKLGYNDDGFVYTDACYGNGRKFTVERTASWDTDVRLIVEVKNEGDDDYHEEWDRHYHLNRINYNFWFFESTDDGLPIEVPREGRRTVNLDTVDLDADGEFGYKVEWSAGFPGDGGFDEIEDADFLKPSQDGRSVEIDGVKMNRNQRVKDNGGRVYLRVDVWYNDSNLGDYNDIGDWLQLVSGNTIHVGGISLDKDKLEVVMGSTGKLNAVVTPSDASDPAVTWKSSNPDVAEVSNDGTVKGKTPGIVVIGATTKDGGYTAMAEVTVQFKDVVKTSAWYYGPVYWAVGEDITTGYKDSRGNLTGKFGPGDPCTREQIVTFLWRMMGSPEPKTTSSFKDVDQKKYYAKAISWAAENNITTGKSKTEFGVGDPCTREQCVTFLYRAAGEPEFNAGEGTFTDVVAGKYYVNAVAWAAQNDITTGYKDDKGNPTGVFGVGDACTRGHIVTFLQRFADYNS